jgi:hypothetical protein
VRDIVADAHGTGRPWDAVVWAYRHTHGGAAGFGGGRVWAGRRATTRGKRRLTAAEEGSGRRGWALPRQPRGRGTGRRQARTGARGG